MHSENLCIITPCFDDREALELLIRDIACLPAEGLGGAHLHLFVVNDSPWYPIAINRFSPFIGSGEHGANCIRSIRCITLNCNVGHQQALYIGLSNAFREFENDSCYLLMDCDGEDAPSHIITLNHALNTSPVFAAVASRSKRHEHYTFKIGYAIYKTLFNALSGFSIDFGNFMYLRPEAARALVYSSYSSSHLAASLLRSKVPFKRLYINRSMRYSGKSQMGGNISLVAHGIKAVSIFADQVMTRLLIASTFAIVIIFLFLILLVFNYYLRVVPPVPGWTSLIVAALVILAAFGSLMTLNSLLLRPSVAPLSLDDLPARYVQKVELLR